MNVRPSLQRAAYRVWLAVGVLALVYAAFYVLGKPLAVVVPPLLVAVIIVYLLNPTVTAFQRRHVPRWVGATVAYLGLLGGVVVLIWLLVPLLSSQLRTFADMAPDLITNLVNDINAVLDRVGLRLPVLTSIDGEALAEGLEGVFSSEGSMSAVVAVLGGLSGIATGLVHFLLVALLGPIIAFYLLVDLPRLADWVRDVIPPTYRDEVSTVGVRLGDVVGGYIRGQLLVALFVGAATSFGLAMIGLPFWLLVGLLAGVTNLIPLLGPLVAGFVGVTIAVMSEGVGLALLVVLVVTLVQQIDNHVVSPLVMGRTVRLHPLIILLALLVAGTVYGLFGLIVAVPAVAAANVLTAHVWQTRVPWSDDNAPERVATVMDSPPPLEALPGDVPASTVKKA